MLEAKEALRELAQRLGAPREADMWEVLDRVRAAVRVLEPEDALIEYERIIEEGRARCESLFVGLPQSDLVIALKPWGLLDTGWWAGYYPDGYQDSLEPCFVIRYREGVGEVGISRDLTCHETYPGHHLQIALADELDLPRVRREYSNLVYTEGWATYAETLAFEEGWYENDPGSLGTYLETRFYEAAAAVLDTGIHALGWTHQQAEQFQRTMYGEPLSVHGWTDLITVRPSAYLGYWLGHYTFMTLRTSAEDAIGDSFDLREFHDVVLRNGVLPLPVLEDVVEAYIEETLAD